MSDSLISIIQGHARPIQPVDTGVTPKLKHLRGIKAVVWDVYGTMFISASGDIESTHDVPHESAMQNAFAALQVDVAGIANQCVTSLHTMIRQHQAQLLNDGIEYPEIDICQVWSDWTNQALPDRPFDHQQIRELIVRYEVQTNPVWEMPNLRTTLTSLQNDGKTLGIISNAQFYTRLIPQALLNASFSELGFDDELCVYSYEHRHGKPDTFLYHEQVRRLASQNIKPSEVLYVGNDMLKDIWPATKVGFQTALFAGDQRSLKLRQNDSRIDSINPSLVLTDLVQIIECV